MMERFSIEDVVEGTEDRVFEDLSDDPVGQMPGVSCLDRAYPFSPMSSV